MNHEDQYVRFGNKILIEATGKGDGTGNPGVVINRKHHKQSGVTFVKVLFLNGEVRGFPANDRRILRVVGGEASDIHHTVLMNISFEVRNRDLTLAHEHFAEGWTESSRKKSFGSDNQMNRGRCVYDNGRFKVPAVAVWLDIGSSFGPFLLWMIHKGVHEVICVEACVDTFSVLTRNRAMIMGAYDEGRLKIECINAAVVVRAKQIAAGGNVMFHVHNTIAGRSTTMKPVTKNVKFTTTKVPGITLQSLLDKYPHVSALKIDTQGNERELVLDVSDWKKVTHVVLEYDFEYNDSFADFHAFIANMTVHFRNHYPDMKQVSGKRTVFPSGVMVYLWK